jgi:hypothetical protein
MENRIKKIVAEFKKGFSIIDDDTGRFCGWAYASDGVILDQWITNKLIQVIKDTIDEIPDYNVENVARGTNAIKEELKDNWCI